MATKRFLHGAIIVSALAAALPLLWPPLLGFPFQRRIGQHQIYSDTPLPANIARIVSLADARVADSRSGSFRAPDQTVFLTNGGWRWSWLSLSRRGPFALTRAVNEAIIVNRSDIASDLVFNDAPIGGRRSLSGTIAHEMTHGSLRAHFGWTVDFRYPAELREGYCDYVAGGGSLSDDEARTMLAKGIDHPALKYWSGRQIVATRLAKAGASLDELFATWSTD